MTLLFNLNKILREHHLSWMPYSIIHYFKLSDLDSLIKDGYDYYQLFTFK